MNVVTRPGGGNGRPRTEFFDSHNPASHLPHAKTGVKVNTRSDPHAEAVL